MEFFKYQGAGNDFIMIDQRAVSHLTRRDQALIEQLCDRRFGIGADGLILLQQKEGYDFEMIYFNADGRESSMCGNGGRCIVSFAKQLEIIDQKAHFWAIDGPHEALINGTGNFVELKMQDVSNIESYHADFVLNTGSPHYIRFVPNLAQVDVDDAGRTIRNSPDFEAEGINVNFVEINKNGLLIGTYERGVEGETLACGTGVTAAALAYQFSTHQNIPDIKVHAKGGDMQVKSRKTVLGFEQIWLCGPSTFVYSGTFPL